MVGVPYNMRHIDDMPDYFCDEQDPKARGIRKKRARFRELVAKYMNMTADAITWPDISDILPEMPPTTLEEYTQSAGWSALIKKDGFHIVSGICAGFIGEWTEYFVPRGVIVSNPYNTKIDGTYIFGENAVLLRNDTHMQGLFPIICPRVELLVENDISILCGMENLRVINMIHAVTDSMKTAAESFFQQVKWGRHGIITGKDSKNKWSGSPDAPTIQNLPTGGVPTNYLIQFIEAAQYTRACLYNDLGLQYNANMKREALNSAETTMNADVLRPVIDNMMECRRRFCDDVKTVFGVEISPPVLSGAWGIRQKMAENAVNPETETTETETHESEVEKDDTAQNN